MALTLRLNEDEKKELDKIKMALDVKSSSKAIRTMIFQFLELKSNFENTEEPDKAINSVLFEITNTKNVLLRLENQLNTEISR